MRVLVARRALQLARRMDAPAEPRLAPEPVRTEAEAARRREEIQANLREVAARIQEAAARAGRADTPPRLVAVSKTKPVSDVLAAYAGGHRHFGENYVQELVDKAPKPAPRGAATGRPQLPADIAWHFIGHVQSNKVKLLAQVPNLAVVETVSSTKLASALDKAWAGRDAKLSVFVQVNTSGEDTKFGVEPGEVVPLVQHIRASCPHLAFDGLMTIGEYAASVAAADGTAPINPNFVSLVRCRAAVAEACGLAVDEIGLSMGMSHDVVQAVEQGSTNVRVGSTIFGARTSPPLGGGGGSMGGHA